MEKKHVVDAEIVIIVDGNGNRVSSYSGSTITRRFQFDTERVLKLFNNKIIVYLKNPLGFSNAVYISSIHANMHDGRIIIDTIEFDYYGGTETKSLDLDRPFYPVDLIGTPDKWTLYVEEGTFDEKMDQEWFIPINESSNLMDKTRLTIGDIYELQWDEGMWIVQLTNLSNLMFTCMCCDKTSPDYGKEPTLSISYCQNHGVRMRNRHCSKHNESIGRSFTTYSQKEDTKMSKDNIIKQRDPETTKGIIPATHYEFDPEYFYKMCVFTVLDLRSDPVTRYECILIETNPTYLVFAAFDVEKEYSSKGAFNNIKRLTVNMDRYMAGEFQLIRHVWDCVE